MSNLIKKPSSVLRIGHLWIGLLCVLLVLSGCRKEPPESQPDTKREQIQEALQKVQEAASQAEQFQKQAESELAAVKGVAKQVMTQKNVDSDESVLQTAQAAAEASLKASQSAGEQAEAVAQHSEEIQRLIAAGDNEAEAPGTDLSGNEKARSSAEDSLKGAQASYNQAKNSSELAQEYLELIEDALGTISESQKSVESAHKAISDGMQNVQNRPSIEAAIENIENMQAVLGESISNRPPDEIAQLLDQLQAASDLLTEQLSLGDDFKDSGTEPAVSPQMEEQSQSTGRSQQISTDQIPGVPPPPKIVRPPLGSFETPELPIEDENRSTGKWIQTVGENEPDFLPGNYSSSELDFKVSGILEVKRTFGEKNEMTIRWRIGYEWNKERSVLTLGKDPKKRPLPSSLKSFSVSEFDISAKAAVLPFPAVIDCKQIDENRLKIGSKTYCRQTSSK